MKFRRFGGSGGSGGVGGYCYVFYDYERGVAVERRCGFERSSDALAALEERVEELVGGGARCWVLEGEVGAGGTPVYLCEAPGSGGVVRLVGRVDVEAVDAELAAERRAEKLAAVFVLWWVLFALLAIIVTLLG